ncbi:MAG: tRNA (adenine-N1)-methyltransferase [Aquificota bacterium]|nr:MAG: tRNA (adenine-N1)-methyltransferase [Aquificota bacterium]
MDGKRIARGDIILLVSKEGKEFLVQVDERVFGTHLGNVDLGVLIDQPWGMVTETHKGKKLYVLRPSLYDLTRHIKRRTQIIFPKDLGFILMKLEVGPGKRVIECGTGSGSLTLALAWMAGPTGKVISYEREETFSLLARENLDRVGLIDRVEFKVKDVQEGFDEEEVDALFLDVKNPWDYLEQAHRALAGGRTLGILVPTTNQVSQVLTGLEEKGFVYPEVCEILLRRYKANPERLRPEDRMVAHTGFLIFARKALREEGERPNGAIP